MSLNQRIRAALLPIVPIVEPNRYDGEALEYITFRYDTLTEISAEGRPGALRHLVTVNWYLPNGVNPAGKKRQIAEELWAAGLTYPQVVDASDEEGQHYAFECEAADGHV